MENREYAYIAKTSALSNFYLFFGLKRFFHQIDFSAH